MARRAGRAAPFVVLFAAVALAFAAPAGAHEGERHPPANEQPAAEESAPGHDMPAMDADDLRWPTAEDMSGMAGHDERPTTLTGRFVRWLGAWHPAVIHFPVALILTVAFLELAAAVRRKPIYNASNKILLAVGTLAAFVAAPLGWISAGLPAPDDESALTLHRWLGTAIPFLFLALWALKKPAEEAAVRKSPPLYEALLAAAVLVILAQAYLGAEVTHGAEHLAF
ncbi:MAG: DUF2231 domain-containing protein [Hyphomonadaceae bacterium]